MTTRLTRVAVPATPQHQLANAMRAVAAWMVYYDGRPRKQARVAAVERRIADLRATGMQRVFIPRSVRRVVNAANCRGSHP